jgi:hypothetical protein
VGAGDAIDLRLFLAEETPPSATAGPVHLLREAGHDALTVLDQDLRGTDGDTCA